MGLLRKVSIKNKIVMVVLSVCSLTIGLGLSLDFIYSTINIKKSIVNNTSMSAKLTGEYCITALSFNYPDRAGEILEKLNSMPQILNGYVYDESSNLFASYNKAGENPVEIPAKKEASHRFEGDYLHLWEPIFFRGKHLGTLYLRVYTQVTEKIRNHFIIMVSVMFGLLVLSYVFAVTLQRIISGPILKLAQMSREISSKGDYSFRAQKKSEDEVGVLYDEFNSMLDVIQSREEELESKNAELERFTYTVSHDLKSPLITIKGFLGLLEKEAAGGNVDQMKKDISRIAAAADTMQELLDELLELSRIGRLINTPEEVPFKDLVDDAKRLVEGRLIEKNVRLEIESDLPVIFGDRNRLREILENLLDNSAKNMGEQSRPCIKVGSRPDGKEIVFYVQDNGIGIDPEYHDQVFGLFDKLDQSIEGTGVGLAIVKRIVEVHKGRIWVESEGEGKGTTFCFTIPDQRIKKIKEV
jgi:signal transduction histidine kinase